MEPKRILVCTSPRTGSNLLVDSLGRHPWAISGGEWFNEQVDPVVAENRQHPNALYRCNLFKFFPPAVEHPHFQAIAGDAWIVFLYRIDIDAQLHSWERACRTGWWTAEGQGEPEPFQVQMAREYIEEARRVFSDVADIHVSYECLVSRWDRIIRAILAGAGWKMLPLPQARQKIPRHV